MTTLITAAKETSQEAADLEFQNACTSCPNFLIEKHKEKRILTTMRLATPRRQANKVLIDKRKDQFS